MKAVEGGGYGGPVINAVKVMSSALTSSKSSTTTAPADSKKTDPQTPVRPGKPSKIATTPDLLRGYVEVFGALLSVVGTA
jgi:hypothetical protein